MTASALHTLADRLGILSEYVDQTGRETRVTEDVTRVAIIAAMGFDASTEERAAAALTLLEVRDATRTLPPVRVLVHGSEFSIPTRGAVLTLERGGDWREGKELPIGYHTLTVGSENQTLIVVPPKCMAPIRPAMGLIANLYAVRSDRNWGVGDITDLATIAEWSGEKGAAFVGVNPLHALRNRGHGISPYSPVSRLYRNPIYIDITAVPELGECTDVHALLEDPETIATLVSLRSSTHVDYDRAWALKRRALEMLHRTFIVRHRDARSGRGRDYRTYIEQEGATLVNFATFCALDDHFAGTGELRGWQQWPIEYRHPASADVVAFRAGNENAVDFHRWMQFELDRQIGSAATLARESGLGIGIYQDLAIGAAPDSADVWAFGHLFLTGVSVGAPPDGYAPQGQNWGLPPIDPRQLVEDRYAFWIALIRATLRHAGALRIDHILGLFRQFWIPAGMPGKLGAYVRFPTAEMLGILALESVRHHALVVGEDLGTVPPEVPDILERWGILSSRVMYFERESDGRFRPASSYPKLSLTTADTHDMATITGFWTARDIELQHMAGLIQSDEQAAAAHAHRENERRFLVERLVAEGALKSSLAESPSNAELRGAVHRFLCSTPAALVGVYLEDLVGEREPVNLPGVSADLFRSWTRRLSHSLEMIAEDPEVAIAFPDPVRAGR
ncbi:MAG: 4-alpha-glucanotransferase [Gemmatimonadaceae bacterium]